MLTLFFVLMNLSWAESPLPPSGLDYRLDADLSYFKTESNFVAGGSSAEDLRNGGSFTDLRTELKYTQDWDRWQRFYGGLGYNSVESSDGVTTRTNSGLSELLFGYQYWLKISGQQLVPQADVVYPIFRVNREGDDALIGEGALKVRGGGWWLFRHGPWHPFVYLGYEYRDEGRSHAIPYALGVKWESRSFWIEPQYRGYERLFANADTENRGARDTFLEKVDGGSYRYFAINSALSELALEGGYRIGRLTLRAGAAYTVNGSSAAQGFTVAGGISYVPGGVAKDSELEADPTEPIESDRFLELDPTRPPRESPEPKVQMRPARKAAPTVAPTPPAAPAAKPKKPKKNKVDKMLEETEKGLQNL